jgi:6-phosphogluconolactonase
LSGERADNSPNHGYVYTETNEASGNSILVYEQAPNGNLTLDATVASGGNGAGMALGSQGALALSDDKMWLFAVNAGSNSVSSFSVDGGDLTLVATASSGGTMPVSLTVYDEYVYVVNAGSSNIQGFEFDDNGMLTALDGSNQPLSGDSVMPAEILFSNDGTALYVTEKATNMITSFALDADFIAGAPMPHPSSGMTPFGFEQTASGHLIVTNAAGGAPMASSVTSYNTTSGGGLSVADGPVSANQTAACWIALGLYGYGYVTNTGSNTISTYSSTASGDLMVVHAVAAASGDHPIDIAVSATGKFVYNINAFDQTIGVYRAKDDGTLMSRGFVSGITPFASGLVTY